MIHELYYQHYGTCESISHFFADSAPSRVRHAHADNADLDGSSTISQSVAMAIAGSPLAHAKVNPFAIPTVVRLHYRHLLSRHKLQICSFHVLALLTS